MILMYFCTIHAKLTNLTYTSEDLGYVATKLLMIKLVYEWLNTYTGVESVGNN